MLAVDQFEETFTLCRDEAERARFVEALLRCARDPQRPILVILAIRADYYGRCAAYPELSRALGVNHALVGPMHREELRRAIELPARRAGLPLEPALADALVDDVAGEPGGLPLLSTALLELSEDELTLAAYERSGGVHGAVARLAEGAYERLDPDGRERARRLLLRLSGDGDARARVPIAELDAGDVLDTLAAERLVTLGDGEAELAHEALLREWPRLRGWLDEDAEGPAAAPSPRAGRARVGPGRDATRRSCTAARGSAPRSTGPPITPTSSTPTEREFLDASAAAAEQAAERDRRANRRLRALLAGAAVAARGGGGRRSRRALPARARPRTRRCPPTRSGSAPWRSRTTGSTRRCCSRAPACTWTTSVATHGNLLTVLMRQPAALGELRGDGWPLYSLAARGIAAGDRRRARRRDRLRRGDASQGVELPRRRGSRPVTCASRRTRPRSSSSGTTSDGTTGLDLIDAADRPTLVRRVELPPFPDEAVLRHAPSPSSTPTASHLVVLQSRRRVRGRRAVGPAARQPAHRRRRALAAHRWGERTVPGRDRRPTATLRDRCRRRPDLRGRPGDARRAARMAGR